MYKATNWFRKNIGMIISAIGLVLLVILTFGDIGELFTDKYWENVGGNLSSISALTIGLVMIQVAIKQGVSEQALSAGLNTDMTKKKYTEHKAILEQNRERQIFLPYFLDIKNKRETSRRKKEFLVDNNFTSEKMLFLSKNKKLIKAYKQIKTNITVDSIKWSTTTITYNKNGRIEKLDTYRRKRALTGLLTGFVYIFASTLITGGLFLDVHDIPFWQKVVKLITYLVVIALTVVFDIGKNYEKGAFGVPNELDEVNSIWKEFELWQIPQWVIEDIEKNSGPEEDNKKQDKKEELLNEKQQISATDGGTDIQEEQKESQDLQDNVASGVLDIPSTDSNILNFDDQK